MVAYHIPPMTTIQLYSTYCSLPCVDLKIAHITENLYIKINMLVDMGVTWSLNANINAYCGLSNVELLLMALSGAYRIELPHCFCFILGDKWAHRIYLCLLHG